MESLQMKKNKWFNKSKFKNIFQSKKKAQTFKEAFEKSILKWELIAEGWNVNNSVETCGLCDLYYLGVNCYYCPIYERTGQEYCHETPYEKWSEIIGEDEMEEVGTAKKDMLAKYAREELKFLKKLKEETLS